MGKITTFVCFSSMSASLNQKYFQQCRNLGAQPLYVDKLLEADKADYVLYILKVVVVFEPSTGATCEKRGEHCTLLATFSFSTPLFHNSLRIT